MLDGPLRPAAETEPRLHSQVRHESWGMEASNKTINHYTGNLVFSLASHHTHVHTIYRISYNQRFINKS
jgi:hypothetical protein